MAQPVATRLLVFPLMKEDFRVCHPLLARGDCASATLNHQNWTRTRFNLQNTSGGGDARRRGSADDLVGLEEQRRGDRQAEGTGGLEVDDQLELRGLLDRQVSRLGPFEDFIHVSGSRQ